jgi:hypothetical protein
MRTEDGEEIHLQMQIPTRHEAPVFAKQAERFRSIPAKLRELLLFGQSRIHLLDHLDVDQRGQ